MSLFNALRWRNRHDHTCRTVDCGLDAGEHDLLCPACRDRQPAANQPTVRYRYTAGGNDRRST